MALSRAENMRALFLESFNAPFTLREIRRPKPSIGEVLVRIMASGVNPLDIKIRSGQAEHAQVQLAAVLGMDLAGVVEEVGANVTVFKRLIRVRGRPVEDRPGRVIGLTLYCV